jgi:hypothetical protein
MTRTAAVLGVIVLPSACGTPSSLPGKPSSSASAAPSWDVNANELFHIPPLTALDQFQDSVAELNRSEPKVKTFDLQAMIDNSLVENAAARGVGSS